MKPTQARCNSSRSTLERYGVAAVTAAAGAALRRLRVRGAAAAGRIKPFKCGFLLKKASFLSPPAFLRTASKPTGRGSAAPLPPSRPAYKLFVCSNCNFKEWLWLWGQFLWRHSRIPFLSKFLFLCCRCPRCSFPLVSYCPHNKLRYLLLERIYSQQEIECREFV